MVSKMRFDVKVVKEYLVKNKYVLTVRGFDYGAKSVAEVDNVGLVNRLRLKEVRSIDDIRGFERHSGFASAEEWWLKIATFGACKGYIYRVATATQ